MSQGKVLFVSSWPKRFKYPVDQYNYPLVRYRKKLLAQGLELEFLNVKTTSLVGIDWNTYSNFRAVFLDGRQLTKVAELSEVLLEIRAAKLRIILFDHGDDVRFYFPEAQDQVDLYVKRQVSNKEVLSKKVILGWDYRYISFAPFKWLRYLEVYYCIPVSKYLRKILLQVPKNKDWFCAVGVGHHDKDIAEKRKTSTDTFMRIYDVENINVSRLGYLFGLRRSRYCWSPSGFGSFCLRDVESLFLRTVPVKEPGSAPFWSDTSRDFGSSIINLSPKFSFGDNDALPEFPDEDWFDFSGITFCDTLLRLVQKLDLN